MSQPVRPRRRLPNPIPRDKQSSALWAEIRSLVGEFGNEHGVHRLEREDLEKLKARMGELLDRVRRRGDAEQGEEPGAEGKAIAGLEWLIRVLSRLAEAGLTTGDSSGIREIRWQSADGNDEVRVQVGVNRTFSLTLVDDSAVSLDILCDCTLCAHELKQALPEGETTVGLEVTAVPPESVRLNMGGGSMGGYLYSQFVRSLPPAFYIEKLTVVGASVTAEGISRDLGRPGKLELDMDRAQIKEYRKEADGSYRQTITYDF